MIILFLQCMYLFFTPLGDDVDRILEENNLLAPVGDHPDESES